MDKYIPHTSNAQKARSRIGWRPNGDQVTKEFFQNSRQTPLQNSMMHLEDSNGSTRTSQSEMGDICLKFYSKVYVARDSAMIMEAIQKINSYTLESRSLIALLHKDGDRSTLNNWRSIKLLNIAYKLFAKAL